MKFYIFVPQGKIISIFHFYAIARGLFDRLVQFLMISMHENWIKDDLDEDTLIVELSKLRDDEKSLQKKLETAEKEYFQTQKDIKFLKTEVSDLSMEEVKLEREYATLKAELANLEEEQKSHDLEHRSMDSHLRKLKNLSPLAAAFHISRKGKYGVINGLRLGFMEDDPVTWEELSAAWGQTALLTKIIIDKAGFKIDKYTICPLGKYTVKSPQIFSYLYKCSSSHRFF